MTKKSTEAVQVEVLATIILERHSDKTKVIRFREIENDLGLQQAMGDPYISKEIAGDETRLKILICKA